MKKLVKLLVVLFLVSACSEKNEAYNFAFETQDGKEIRYMLEEARTPREQAQGLMNRKSLANNGGMLFLMHPVRHVAMWMKATQIPLDIVFINPQGEVIKIVENAKPLSEDHITSDGEVKAVVEIKGGSTAKNGIKVGDKVKHVSFGNLPMVVTPQKTADKKADNSK